MPVSIRTSKQHPVAVLDKQSQYRDPLKNVNVNNTSSSSIPACDKSTATCSTTELSFSSLTSSSASFAKLSSSKSNNTSLSSQTTVTTNSTPPKQQQQQHRKRSPSKPLNRPVALHPQSSLLDMTMDESHDDDTSFSISPHKPSKSSPTPRKQIRSNNNPDVGSSIMEQTEKNLAAISESMTGSFCANQDNVNNTCTRMLPDCTIHNNSNMSSNKNNDHPNRLFGDTLVQNRLLDDFNYLLGSNVMPCCEEKTIFSSCFGISSYTESDNDGPVHDEFLNRDDESKVRNRAGESWRARAYRIRKLREERMMKQDHSTDQGYGGGYYNPSLDYSLTNRRQVSMERAIGKSHSADGRIDNTNPFHSVKKDLFHSGGSGEVESAGCGGGIIGGGGESSRRPKHEVQSDPLGRMIGDCIDPIAPAKEDAVELEVVWKQNDLDLCYDSDPGETSFRKSLTGGKKTGDMKEEEKSTMNSTPKRFMGRNKSLNSKLSFGRRRRNRYSSLDCSNEEKLDLSASFDVHVSFDNDSEDEDDYSYDGIVNENNRPWFGQSPKLHQVRTKALQEDIGIRQNVQVSFTWSFRLSFVILYSTHFPSLRHQDALNRTWTLTWHPVNQIKAKEKNPKNALRKTLGSKSPAPEATSLSPRAIRLWFERGNRIRGNNIVEPKLMWRDAYNPDLSSQRKLNDSITNGPNQICLLSICRIIDVKHHIDRKLYPFAKKTCSFLIRTCDDEEYLFETQSETERDEIVYLWKLVVARLASQAVVGDGDKMVGEFFVPSTFGVP